eukprot:3724226-Ditylum_brightwellii.AAC.1
MQHTTDNYYLEECILDAAVMMSHDATVVSPGIIMGSIPEKNNECRARKGEQHKAGDDMLFASMSLKGEYPPMAGNIAPQYLRQSNMADPQQQQQPQLSPALQLQQQILQHKMLDQQQIISIK